MVRDDAPVLTVYPMHIQAVWTCSICHRVSVRLLVGVLWDGVNLRGLVCPRHGPDELESSVRGGSEDAPPK